MGPSWEIWKLRQSVLPKILSKRRWNRLVKHSWSTPIGFLVQVVMHMPHFVKVCSFCTPSYLLFFYFFFYFLFFLFFLSLVQKTKTRISVEWFETYHKRNCNSFTLYSGMLGMSIVPYAVGCDIVFVLKWDYKERVLIYLILCTWTILHLLTNLIFYITFPFSYSWNNNAWEIRLSIYYRTINASRVLFPACRHFFTQRYSLTRYESSIHGFRNSIVFNWSVY